ncbi:MAG: sodium:solute symporter family protein, partial [Acidobacteriota bacterium]|nr:sodium:solute symporter family protein [Acidobacteriota bacterium]
MIPAFIVFAYLLLVLYIGIFAFRRGRAGSAEEYFLAGRSLGPAVFLLSLFGTNMTAFTILGSAGHAFANGIVTFSLMASAFVIPLTLFFIGTRLWALGKRHGFMTPVQMFRDRWECGHIGTVIFVVQAALLVPYIIIGVMGGGTALRGISGGFVPFWLGGAIVAVVVMSYVFFGGMRGTAFVNTFQTVLFLTFGAIALVVIGRGMGGFPAAMESLLGSPSTAPLLTRERISPWYYFSYTFIPLSTIAFPHIAIFCLTAKRMVQFKRTVIFYPICLLAIWLPCVFLGVAANSLRDVPQIEQKLEARAAMAALPPTASPEERAALRRQAAGDDVVLVMLERFAPLWLAGILGAGIMAAVMASDSQILALSTMFTEDVFTFYGGTARFGEGVQIQTGRLFVVLLTILAYAIALRAPQGIFDLAVQYAFSGYSALSPLLVAALFWRRSTKWGALAVTLWVAFAVIYTS